MADEHTQITWDDVEEQALAVADRWKDQGIAYVHGVPQGGYPVAVLVAEALGARVMLRTPLGSDGRVTPREGTLVVDDLVDSGRTLSRFIDAGFRTDALFRKPETPNEIAPRARTRLGWLVFPWERATGPEDAVVRLLEHVGENPAREGLLNTPGRVVKALREMTEGYSADVPAILATTFDEQSDEMVVLSGIRFASMCEHHMLPFVGTATVGYIPGRRVVGLSKMARLVHAYARRLQVQERMTSQIAAAMEEHLQPRGVGVVIHGQHMCMSCRGVNQAGATMTTSAMLGIMKHSDAARAEFLRLANGG